MGGGREGWEWRKELWLVWGSGERNDAREGGRERRGRREATGEE